MALYRINGLSVKKITTKDINLEKDLQKLFEDNLDEILNLVFLAHEYSTGWGGRIDTLAIDKDGAPCIIEYKKNQNDNVINQGLSYLRWLFDHKADFEKLVEQHFVGLYDSPIVTWNGKVVDRIKIDWDSPRVICIAESYNKFDLDTADILPIQVELFRYRIYDGDILYLEPENSQRVRVSMNGITKKSKQENEKHERLQKTYSVDDHVRKANTETQSIFFKLREKITSLDKNIKEEPKKLYIAYKLATNFVDISIIYGTKTQSIKLWLNVKSGQLHDPNGLARDLAKPKPVGHWGNGDYEVKLESEKELDAVFALIKQSYDLNK